MPPRIETSDTTEATTSEENYAQQTIANNRLMEFIMGPAWVAARMRPTEERPNALQRMGHSLTTSFNRLRGRPSSQRAEAGAAMVDMTAVGSSLSLPTTVTLSGPLSTEEEEVNDRSAVQLEEMTTSDHPVVVSIPLLEDASETR